MAIGTAIGVGEAVGGALQGLAGLAGSGINYFANKELQRLDHEYQANEAQKAREYQSREAQINRDWQTNANKIAMDFNAEQAAAQRAWEEKMRSNAHQVQMEDLRKAGLNPILAASMGGADTPNGASAQGVATSPNGAPTASTARGSSQHFNGSSFDRLADYVGDYLANARRISAAADQHEHERSMQEMRQKHEKSSARSERIWRSKENEKFERDYYRGHVDAQMNRFNPKSHY